MSRYQPVLRGARAIWIAALLLFACRSRPAAVEIPLEALASQDGVCDDLDAARRDALAAPGGAGYSAVQVDAAALDAFVAALRQAQVIVAVSSLLLPHESPPEPATVLRPEGL
jgi:hypothetical protein